MANYRARAGSNIHRDCAYLISTTAAPRGLEHHAENQVEFGFLQIHVSKITHEVQNLKKNIENVKLSMWTMRLLYKALMFLESTLVKNL